MKIVALYVGSSLLSPLRAAEGEINRLYKLDLSVCAYNFGDALTESVWREVERDVNEAEIVFVFHVTDGENAARLIPLLRRREAGRGGAVIVINCMPDLMRQTRMGKLRFGGDATVADEASEGVEKETGVSAASERRTRKLLRSVGSWMSEQVRARRGKGGHGPQYLRYVERLPALLRFVPGAGRLRDVKNYLYLFTYFLQPTPANIRSMLLYAVKHYSAGGQSLRTKIEITPPEAMPAVGLYHPDAPAIFSTFDSYSTWYARRDGAPPLDPSSTVGLLLMRPQIVSGSHRHYDELIRTIESEGLAVLPAISTFMDNREACRAFFIDEDGGATKKGGRKTANRAGGLETKSINNVTKSIDVTKSISDVTNSNVTKSISDVAKSGTCVTKSRVSQIVSLTGFSFVGGPAMNDSEAAVEFLKDLNRPFRSAVSLDVQTIESWRDSWTGLNPVQAGMQIAIPEIDGATEPFVYGGMPADGSEPLPLADRCRRIARRLRRWNTLRTAKPSDIKIALVVFCFPPNKGNLGTAAELEVFASAWEMLKRLRAEGYTVEVPRDADELRGQLIGGNSESFGAVANVAYRMSADEYERLCPYAKDIETDWGPAPGTINSFGRDVLVHGIKSGNVFIGVQPSFGYEGDPMRMLMAKSGSPHHGFAALYTYLEKVFAADVVVHVGTHGALEFMPGKQVGLSGECWPDRLIGELPHVYIYSVNNPSEGSIARRRSYAELISYLTPPVEDAGLYRELTSFKESLASYRLSTDECEREKLYAVIEEQAAALHFELT
ncbi:MAG: cobaltochelatase subunit CobN [Pyrinomonadaceae bacterium]